MLILSQFVLRLSFGLALAMGLTSPRKVTSGYFRNHSYVLLGLNALATLAAWATRGQSNPLAVAPPLIAAILSYVCAATWLYEKSRLGTLLLIEIAFVSIAGAWMDQHGSPGPMDRPSITSSTKGDELPANSETKIGSTVSSQILWRLDPLTSGLLLGSTIAAMFLGHWYLNTPTMELVPLLRLLGLMALAIVVRSAVSGMGLYLQWSDAGLSSTQYPLIALRWLADIFGTAVLTWMAWQTLKIPNTQSATGILYVAVITTFIGELSSLLLSGSTAFPL